MFLLFDFGGTKLRFALTDNFKKLDEVFIYDSINNYSELLAFITEKASEIKKDTTIEYISGGIAGVVKDNMLVSSPHLDTLINKPFAEDLLKIFGSTRIIIQNDAQLAGLAEATIGAGKDYYIVGYITVSTGVGGTRIVGKKLDASKYGFEPGHQIIQFAEGSYSTFEDLVSGTGLEKKYQKSPKDIVDEKIWLEVETYLAYGLNNLVLTWSPDVIVLGGGIINSGIINLERVAQNLKSILTIFPDTPVLKQSVLGDEVGLYGAMFNLYQEIQGLTF